MASRREFDSLVSEHIEGKPSVHSTQRLDQILKKSPALRQEFTEQAMMHRLLTECCRPAPGRPPLDLSSCPPPPKRSWPIRLYDSIRRLIQPSYCPECRRRPPASRKKSPGPGTTPGRPLSPQ